MSCGTGGQAGLSARSGYAKSKQTGEPELRLSAPAQGRGGREGAKARPEPPGSGTATLEEPPRPARDRFPTRFSQLQLPLGKVSGLTLQQGKSQHRGKGLSSSGAGAAMPSAARAGVTFLTPMAALQHKPGVCLYLPELQRVPVVVHEGQDLLEVKVLLLALHTQVVEGEMDDVHPAAKRGTGSAALAGWCHCHALLCQCHSCSQVFPKPTTGTFPHFTGEAVQPRGVSRGMAQPGQHPLSFGERWETACSWGNTQTHSPRMVCVGRGLKDHLVPLPAMDRDSFH